MKKKGLKKRFITLIEMMIVMFLIAMITGVIAVNYAGSLEEGKAFKTKSGIDKIKTVLELHFASHPQDKISGDAWKDIVAASPLVKNATELEKDGWGVEYQVTADGENGEIDVRSDKYDAYTSKSRASMFGKNSKK